MGLINTPWANIAVYIGKPKAESKLGKNRFPGGNQTTFRIIDTEDGTTLWEQTLSAACVFDGMSAADGRIYLALEDGSIVCLADDQ